LSEKPLSWLVVLEKIVGFIIMIAGIIIFYNTYSNINAAGLGVYYFMAMSIALIILGLVFLIARIR
jgi:hypothetical protein